MNALQDVCRGMKEVLEVKESELSSIAVPVIGIVDEDDEELPFLKRMEGIVPNFKMTTIPNKGHLEGCEDPLHQQTFLAFYNR